MAGDLKLAIVLVLSGCGFVAVEEAQEAPSSRADGGELGAVDAGDCLELSIRYNVGGDPQRPCLISHARFPRAFLAGLLAEGCELLRPELLECPAPSTFTSTQRCEEWPVEGCE